MKYTIVINQVGVVKAGLLGITDFSDWAIIGYIKDLFAHPKSTKLPFKDNLYVWINYAHIIEEMPMLGISTKNPLSDRFKKLKKLSLIDTVALKDNTVYVRLTEDCMNIFSYKEDAIKSTTNTPPIHPNSDRVSIQTPTGGIHPNSDSTSSISNQVVNQSSKTDLVGTFNIFYNRYPKKVSKQSALRAWLKIKPTPDLVKQILDAVDAQKESEQWLKDKGQFIPHPSTWLNNHRWEDNVSVGKKWNEV